MFSTRHYAGTDPGDLLRSPALLRTIADELNLADKAEFKPVSRPPGLVACAKALLHQAALGMLEAVPEPVAARLADREITLPRRRNPEPPTGRGARGRGGITRGKSFDIQ